MHAYHHTCVCPACKTYTWTIRGFMGSPGRTARCRSPCTAGTVYVFWFVSTTPRFSVHGGTEQPENNRKQDLVVYDVNLEAS